jgi:hypothetical protein
MASKYTIQQESDEQDNICELCGNKSRIKELEKLVENMVALEAARQRVKGKQIVVSETPK